MKKLILLIYLLLPSVSHAQFNGCVLLAINQSQRMFFSQFGAVSGFQNGCLVVQQDTNVVYQWNGSSYSAIASSASGSAISQLTGDVTAGPGPGSVSSIVASVGGSTAANVHSAQLLASAATSANTASVIVKRDASGNARMADPLDAQDIATKNYVDTHAPPAANKSLSNLTSPTAINQSLLVGLDLSYSLGFTDPEQVASFRYLQASIQEVVGEKFDTLDNATDAFASNTRPIDFKTGDLTGVGDSGNTGHIFGITGRISDATSVGNTGGIDFESASNFGIGNTGGVFLGSGSAHQGSSGTVFFITGSAAGGTSGQIEFVTGHGDGSGGVLFQTNSSNTADPTGDISFLAGDNSNSGPAGNINLTPGIGTPNGVVKINGATQLLGAMTVNHVVVLTTPYTVDPSTDMMVIAKLTSPAAVTINLPKGVDGQMFWIKDGTGDAATHNITINAFSGDTFQTGSTTATISTNFGMLGSVYDASTNKWFRLTFL